MGHPRLVELVRKYGKAAVRAAMDAAQIAIFAWLLVARPEQIEPLGDWARWVCCAGRGWGKTRVGAEWVLQQAREHPGCRIALVGRTTADVRDVMVRGDSGILACAHPSERPEYIPSQRMLLWPNGTRAFTYSAEEPDQLRGPQHHAAWCDEIAAWHSRDAWDQLNLGLRLGERPRCVVTTTPRPTALVKELLADAGTHVTRGSTYENRANLSKFFFDQVIRRYEGTRLGRQELGGELLTDTPGALWTIGQLELDRVKVAPPLDRILVGVDPSVTSGEDSDETGIVVAGIDSRGHAYVLADATVHDTPAKWAKAVDDAFHLHRASKVIAETNQGGELVELVLKQVNATMPVQRIHAKEAKQVRAEPVSSLYEQHKIHHVGVLRELEGQLTSWVPEPGAKSPDRLDALVYAIAGLYEFQSAIPKATVKPQPIEDEMEQRIINSNRERKAAEGRGWSAPRNHR